MENQIDLLNTLAIYARDYVQRVGIKPVGNYIDFNDGLRAYCTDEYDFFVMYYDFDTRLTVHTLAGKQESYISFNTNVVSEDLGTLHDEAFKTIFDYEKKQSEILEKQKIAQIAELESKLAKLRDL
jgi:hypothetical protein